MKKCHLSEESIETFTPREKSYRVWGGMGLYLEIMPNGSKYWRFKYRFEKKEKRLALGVYPEVSLTRAREGTLNARLLVKSGLDPSRIKQAYKYEIQTYYTKTENDGKGPMSARDLMTEHIFKHRLDILKGQRVHLVNLLEGLNKINPNEINKFKSIQFKNGISKIDNFIKFFKQNKEALEKL
jgi:hypothetical protein